MRHFMQNFFRVIPRNIRTVRKMSQNAARKVAVCQMTSTADKKANLSIVNKLVVEASKENVQMIFFPEACDYICDNKQDMLKLAESVLNGETVGAYRDMAKRNNVWLSMGGIHEKDDKNPKKVFNTHLIIDNEGSVVQAYRKLHLFDVEIPEKNVRLKESDFANAGSDIVTPVPTPAGHLGLAVCYDMRFPELSTNLASMGAEILTYPSAFTKPTGEAHWEVILRARAIENQCYVIAAAQVGQHNPKRASFGRALIVDPWGNVIADCMNESPKYEVAEISGERLTEVRRNMPVFQHRRKDVYSLYALSLRNSPLPEYVAQPQPDLSPDPRADRVGPTNVFGHVKVPDTCVFYKSKLTYAFVNIRCVIPGHVLVAPLRLAERNKDLTDEEATDFFKTIRLVQMLMERVHNAKSCTVTIQDGPDAGQTVKVASPLPHHAKKKRGFHAKRSNLFGVSKARPHLHCHILPRKKGDFIENDHIYLELAKHDQLKSGHPSKPARTLEEMEAEAEFLREELKKIHEQKLI